MSDFPGATDEIKKVKGNCCPLTLVDLQKPATLRPLVRELIMLTQIAGRTSYNKVRWVI